MLQNVISQRFRALSQYFRARWSCKTSFSQWFRTTCFGDQENPKMISTQISKYLLKSWNCIWADTWYLLKKSLAPTLAPQNIGYHPQIFGISLNSARKSRNIKKKFDQKLASNVTTKFFVHFCTLSAPTVFSDLRRHLHIWGEKMSPQTPELTPG